MAYTPYYPDWKDDPDHSTPIVADALDRMDEGIENAHSLIATLDGESDAAIAAEMAARVAGDAAVQSSVDAHKADAVDAHTAASISVPPSHVVGADDVDEALADLYAAIVGGGMPSTIIDAKGDLIVGADDDLPTKLAVGADGEILIADAVAPFGLKWGEAPSGLPDPTGNEDEVLTVVGDVAVWAPVPPGLPDTTGEEGNWLTVEGGVAVWNPLEGGGAVDYKGAWAAPTPYAQGDVVLYQGREYVAVNPSTGQTPVAAPAPSASLPVLAYGTTLPASPYDGQEAILVDSLTAPTYSWLFRYVASITDAYKWVFIGGSVASAESIAAVNASTSYTTLTGGPSLVLPRAGIYVIGYGVAVSVWTPSDKYVSHALDAATPLDADAALWLTTGTAGTAGQDAGSIARRGVRRTFAAGTLAMKCKVSTGTVGFSNRWIEAQPARVS